VTGTKDRHSAAKPGDYVFGLSLKGRYKGQPVTGNGKIGGMLALRSASTLPAAGRLPLRQYPGGV
jgi:uncharacterized protein involved in outer membrane biogenesis